MSENRQREEIEVASTRIPLKRHSSQLSVEYKTLTIKLEEARTKTIDVDDKRIKEELDINYHKLTLNELGLRFATSISSGISSSSAARRLQRNGKNAISPPESKLLTKIFEYTFGGFCPLLWFASLICFLAWKPLGEPTPDKQNLGLAILLLIVIFLQAVFNGYQDWTTSSVMKSINKMLPSTAIVTRDGKEQTVPLSNLVVGDLVHLKLGNKVPADIRITEQIDLKFDKSILSGESKPVSASTEQTNEIYLESRNIALMGTLVTMGGGSGIVVAVGDGTVMGKLAKLSSHGSQDKTLLQKEITRFVIVITTLAVLTSSLTLIVWGTWLRHSYPNFINLPMALINAIGVLVAFVPEGLPIAVTLTLTLVARRMASQKVLVKNLTVVETLGSVNVIASDKTGTLTQNRMAITNVHIGQDSYNQGECRQAQLEKSPGFSQLISVGRLCNAASFDPSTMSLSISDRLVLGDGTDAAVLRFVTEYAIDETEVGNFDKIAEIPFNSKNKWMLRIMRPKSASNVYKTACPVLMIKGAPEVLFNSCTRIIDADCNEKPFGEFERQSLVNVQESWSSSGRRVIALCYRIIKNENEIPKDSHDLEALEKLAYNLTVVGLVGILDPPRREIPDVIRTCRAAGIRIFMVTGDYFLTATAIAKQVGIFTAEDVHTITDLDQLSAKLEIVTEKEPRVVTNGKGKATGGALLLNGSDLISLSENQWDLVAAYDEIVFARTTPEQKLSIVQEFQKRHCTVGVTGDGVNDAPALKAADIGIAMGSGSEVSIEAADMVLMDSNFSSVVVALESGRLVFDNLKKVILYLLPAGSWSELVPVLVNVFLGVPLPLSTFLMIAICVLTDILPSIAMMYETPESDLLTRQPRNPRKDRLVNWRLLVQAYLCLGMIETFFSHLMFFFYMHRYGGFMPSDLLLAYDKWTDGYKGHSMDELNELNWTGQCVLFVSLVVMQVFGNIFATRTRYLSLIQHSPIAKQSKNYYLFGAQVGSIAIASFLVYAPMINDSLHTRPVPAQFWFIPLGFAAAIIAVDETRKFFVRRQSPAFFHKIAW
ncbi:9336_t:CDS:1 [Paraglomus brasilianum]|uniref:9336_t:CDS:1 n=1 Tax=Paraglomus brasilianum TaxID=144538 RepID=A0A9N8ZPD4_9GLOM|nr:9336_t:CDS:1 [Paraglomus brasilianum]